MEDVKFADLHWAGKIMGVIMVVIIIPVVLMLGAVAILWLFKAMTWAAGIFGP